MKDIKGSNFNAIYICFAKNENQDLLNCLQDLKNEYNFDIIQCRNIDECRGKRSYDNNIFLFYAESEDELNKFNFDNIRDLLDKSECILCSKNENCKNWKSNLRSCCCIAIRDRESAKNDFRKAFDKVFKSHGTTIGKSQETYTRSDIGQKGAMSGQTTR